MISIITVCFNSEKTIMNTLNSVLEQTYLPKEYIIIDGLSTDKTRDIVLSYKPLFERKGIAFLLVSEKDSGLYDAMNKGMKLASAEWIHFLNSDDCYINQYVLSTVSMSLANADAEIVYGRMIKVNKSRQFTQYDIREKHLKLNMLFGCPVNQPATLFRTALFKEKYSFDTSFKISADYKLFVEMIDNKERFKFIPQYITFFSEDGVSTIYKDSLAIDENIQLLKDCGHTTFFVRLSRHRRVFKILVLFVEFLSRF